MHQMSSTQNAASLVVNRTWRTGLYAKSPKALAIRSRKIGRLVERLRRTMPWLEPSDLPACRAWAEREILSAGAFAALTAKGVITLKPSHAGCSQSSASFGRLSLPSSASWA